MNPSNPAEGDMIVDPSSEKTFYFTGDRWVDITSRYRDIWNEEPVEIGLTSNELDYDLIRGS